MTNPDYRALCAELLTWAEHTSSHYYKQPDVLNRARALLAQPVAVGPTTAELMSLSAACNSPSVFARTVLDRWGRPTPQPPAEGEVAQVVVELQELAESCDTLAMARVQRLLTRAADLLQRQYPQPVAVSERWPDFSDCDPQERVWAWNPVLDHWKLSRINRSVHTHWLPAHALPTAEAL